MIEHDSALISTLTGGTHIAFRRGGWRSGFICETNENAFVFLRLSDFIHLSLVALGAQRRGSFPLFFDELSSLSFFIRSKLAGCAAHHHVLSVEDRAKLMKSRMGITECMDRYSA